MVWFLFLGSQIFLRGAGGGLVNRSRWVFGFLCGVVRGCFFGSFLVVVLVGRWCAQDGDGWLVGCFGLHGFGLGHLSFIIYIIIDSR